MVVSRTLRSVQGRPGTPASSPSRRSGTTDDMNDQVITQFCALPAFLQDSTDDWFADQRSLADEYERSEARPEERDLHGPTPRHGLRGQPTGGFKAFSARQHSRHQDPQPQQQPPTFHRFPGKINHLLPQTRLQCASLNKLKSSWEQRMITIFLPLYLGAAARVALSVQGEDPLVFVCNLTAHRPSGLLYLSEQLQSMASTGTAKVAFCIHNISYQERFSFDDFAQLNLPRQGPAKNWEDGSFWNWGWRSRPGIVGEEIAPLAMWENVAAP
ncbi:hypothetical protein ZWY2020_059682 [Hordeum vulgare]|nr:hypothetical protein ZWY2020_059682 [Hordeum vulgare]